MSQEVPEVCDCVAGVAHKESLGLGTVVFIAISVGQNNGDLTVCCASHLISSDPKHKFHELEFLPQASESSRIKHTTVLVGNDLGLVVACVGNGAVGVTKGDTNGHPVAGLGALCAVLGHCEDVCV